MRSIFVPIVRNKYVGNKTSTSKPKNESPSKEGSKNLPDPKGKERREDNPRSVDQGQTSFILEAGISKIKIFFTLTELLKNFKYHSKFSIVLNPPGEMSAISYYLNLQDDGPNILFAPHVDEPSDEEDPPFYISLNIHNAILHNAMLDSGASHNPMPRRIMDELGLEVTNHTKKSFF